MRALSLACLAILVSLSAGAAADTVRLQSGDVVAGDVADRGDRIEVTTGDGVVSLRWRDVDVVRRDTTPADEFAERRAALAKDDAGALYELALWAERAGLVDESRACAARVAELDPEHTGARALLAQEQVDGAWLSGERLLAAKGFVRRDGAWVLKEEAEAADRRATPVRELSDDEKRADELIHRAASGPERAQKFALEALDGMSAEALARPALRALRRGEPAERRLAARLLARWGDVDALRPLLHAAVLDREKSVRDAAVAALREIGHPDTVRPLARALWSPLPLVRTNAAEALGAFGGGQSVEWLIRRLKTSGGPGGRNSIFIGRQLSYISDFDVEIAQAAQIGDPIVGTIREGVSLDTRVLGVNEEFTAVERRVFYRSLRQATGVDHGEDVAAWEAWYEKDGRAALASAAQPSGGADTGR